MPNSANLRPIPAQPGNRLAERHGFYITALSPIEGEEIEEIATAIRELSPVDADALEPLIQLVAGQLWRRRKAYTDLEANGLIRARGKVAPILRDLATLERSILDGLKALALTPQAAASLNLTLTRTRSSERFNVDALTTDERQALDRLLTKARMSG